MKKLQSDKKLISKQNTVLEESLLLGVIRLTMTGAHQLLVENFKGISYFDNQKIVVQSQKNLVSISGKNLQIRYYTKDEMSVVGNIEKIELKGCDF